jgi:hypothetical protein
MAFALACHERGIRLVDLQHGVQGSLHPAYGRFPPSPPGGFELVPQRFWVWSQEESDAVSEWAGSGQAHRAIIGGNVWLDRWLSGDGSLTAATGRRVAALRARFPDAKVVLVTLQWGLSDAEQFAPLIELIRRGGAEWVWWIRLHPVMLRERALNSARFLELGLANVLVDEPTDLPLYGLLRGVDVHLTHSSSTVIEAGLFGVNSVVTSQYGAELYPRHMADGTARLVENGAEATLRALREQREKRGVIHAAGDRAGPALRSLLDEAGIRSGTAT